MVAEIISFGDTAERLIEVATVMLLGLCLGLYWDWRAVPLALAFYFVIRPLAALVFLARTPTGMTQRLLMGWFGIRGIGSLYYLAYALNHGLAERVPETVSIALSAVALSIIVHGISSQPILAYYERSIRRRSSNIV